MTDLGLIACIAILVVGLGIGAAVTAEKKPEALPPQCVNLTLQAPGFAVQRNGVTVVEFGRP